MDFTWNRGEIDEFASQIVAATEEAYDAVAAEHTGDSIDTVRSALKSELSKRFEPGSGPDAALIEQMAARIHAG